MQFSPCKKVNGNEKELELNEFSNKSVTKILLLELRNIKKSLLRSSSDIEKVFKSPIGHLKLNGKIVPC